MSESTKLSVSDVFLLLWWADHGKETGFYEHLEEMVSMDERQAAFAAGLPTSGRKLALEEAAISDELIKRLADCYKQEFLSDGPLKKNIWLQLLKEKAKAKMLREVADPRQWTPSWRTPSLRTPSGDGLNQ